MAEYLEDGCIMDVTVLEDNSDKEWEGYKLRVNKIFQSSILFNDPEVGKEFTAIKKRGTGCSGLWHLFGTAKRINMNHEIHV
jgi:hypothetical protein